MDLSIVVPVYNEEDSLPHLHRQICQAMGDASPSFQIILVNDGSTDASAAVMDRIAAADPQVVVVHLRRNFGQTAALSAGIDAAEGQWIAMLDADLQNDPADLPSMLEKLKEGYDLVHGWRVRRQDAFWHRRLPSFLANRLIRWVTGVPIRDLGCTLKVMRQEIARDLPLYGDMHRFIAILAHHAGAHCVEVPTRHHARQFGQTKYGISRTFRVVLDLLTVKFLIQYATSPMRLFGSLGLVSSAAAGSAALAVIAMKLAFAVDMTGNPLLYLAILGGLAGLQFFSLGLLGEMNTRSYFETRAPSTLRDSSNRETFFEKPRDFDLRAHSSAVHRSGFRACRTSEMFGRDRRRGNRHRSLLHWPVPPSLAFLLGLGLLVNTNPWKARGRRGIRHLAIEVRR